MTTKDVATGIGFPHTILRGKYAYQKKGICWVDPSPSEKYAVESDKLAQYDGPVADGMGLLNS